MRVQPPCVAVAMPAPLAIFVEPDVKAAVLILLLPLAWKQLVVPSTVYAAGTMLSLALAARGLAKNTPGLEGMDVPGKLRSKRSKAKYQKSLSRMMEPPTPKP